MEQSKALNALEPFVLLSKSANSPRAAADLITQATSASNTYVFAELLQTPNIQALRDAPSEYFPYLTLLEIFAWGTWADYHCECTAPILNSTKISRADETAAPNLPPLNDTQSLKLRQLSLLPLAESHAQLTYPNLLSALSIPTVRALEDLVISAIYAGLLSAKLDTAGQRVSVYSVAPLRDLRPGSIPAIISTLDEWNGRCVDVLDDIEKRIQEVRRKAAEKGVKEKDLSDRIAEKMSGHDKGGKRAAEGDGPAGVYSADKDEMEIDETLGDYVPSRSTKRGGGRFGRR